MKVGTLTFHAPNNNGSFLQEYALQNVLNDLGIENEIINYYSEKQEEQYRVFRKSCNASAILKNIISLVHFSGLQKRFRKFNEMRDEFLIMTPRLKTEGEVYEVVKNYDAIICGSDQIWNTRARDFSMAYFLPDVNKKKITYAVSCGTHIEDIDIEKVVFYAKTFDRNAFRERKTLQELQKRGLENSIVVLDPTLLLNSDCYDKLIPPEIESGIQRGKYIFLYTINYSDDILKEAKIIGEKLKLPVVTVFSGYSVYKCIKYGIKVIYDSTPDIFLWMIQNASVCCTNSFHGTAFSIIFHKEFYRLCDKDAHGQCVYDDRIDGLLDELGILGNKVSDAEEFVRYTPDYSSVDNKMELLRTNSIQYLVDALGRGVSNSETCIFNNCS